MSGVLSTIGSLAYKTAYQISPIILKDGIAKQMPFGMLPVVAITEATTFVRSLISGNGVPNLNSFFGHFEPVSGGALFKQHMGTYPFLNLTVAANATMSDPLTFSIRMNCPVNQPGGHTAKLLTMTALKAVLERHAKMSGTFIVATPACLYRDCILLDLIDATEGGTKQWQSAFQWNFSVPLVTEAQAIAAQSTLMGKISAGMPTDGATSGPASTIGASSGAAIGPTQVPTDSLQGTPVPPPIPVQQVTPLFTGSRLTGFGQGS